MKVLVACEYSGVVQRAFNALGHNAWSCDILPTEGSTQHIQGNVLDVLDMGWDLMIAHPPCTYLSNSGVSWLYREHGRWANMQRGALFFKRFLDADIPHIAVENPIMHKYAVEIIGRRQDQVIQPYHFGHGESKATCLWLKNLPKLQYTEIVQERVQRLHYLPPSPDRAKLRSKTYEGIAQAMAQQWSDFVINRGVLDIATHQLSLLEVSA